MKKDTKEDDFNLHYKTIFRGKKIPILTLDEKWLSRFSEKNMTDYMRSLQAELNTLLVKEGKLNEDIKGYKKIKAQFMQDIVENMEVDDSFFGKLKAKRLVKNQKKILEVNEQLSVIEDELKELPHKIRLINEQLFSESIKQYYLKLETNSAKIRELEEEIGMMRTRLKQMIVDKQDMEEENTSMYTYMHDMLGHQSMEQLDKDEFRYASNEEMI